MVSGRLVVAAARMASPSFPASSKALSRGDAAVLPHVAYLPLWVVLTFALTFGWRLAIVFSGHEMPASWVRTLGAIGCLAAVFADFGSFIGREQGVAMLTLFLGLKLLEMKARRDLFVVVFLCFFLLLTSFFHSQSMLSTALVLIAVTALTSTMITMTCPALRMKDFKRNQVCCIMPFMVGI